MEQADQIKLDELRKKQPSEVTESERAFLHARLSYLHPHEMNALGFEEPKEEEKQPEGESEVTESEQEPEPTKPSKGLNKVQLQEALATKGIEFAPDATKVVLQSLLDGVSVEDESEEEGEVEE